MHLLILLLSAFLMATVLWDAFETVVLPRTVSRRLRLTRVYFRFTWRLWSRVAASVRSDRRRERFLAVFGPLSPSPRTGGWLFMKDLPRSSRKLREFAVAKRLLVLAWSCR